MLSVTPLYSVVVVLNHILLHAPCDLGSSEGEKCEHMFQREDHHENLSCVSLLIDADGGFNASIYLLMQLDSITQLTYLMMSIVAQTNQN